MAQRSRDGAAIRLSSSKHVCIDPEHGVPFRLYPEQKTFLRHALERMPDGAMGHSAEGITADMLQHVSRFLLTDATLKAANGVVVNLHHRRGFSAL